MRSITMRCGELRQHQPDGEQPETITVDGIDFTPEQLDTITRVVTPDVVLTVQRLRDQRLAMTTEAAPLWWVFEPSGAFEQRPAL
jgi:hypothetical protein